MDALRSGRACRAAHGRTGTHHPDPTHTIEPGQPLELPLWSVLTPAVPVSSINSTDNK